MKVIFDKEQGLAMVTDDDRKFLESFEQCSLGAECWTHAAHVRMGWLMLETSSSFDGALERIRNGIMRFNSAKNSIGYHETITVAFARIIDSRREAGESFEMFAEKNQDLFEKTFLEKFYSAAILRSEQARESFLAPDLEQLPTAATPKRGGTCEGVTTARSGQSP